MMPRRGKDINADDEGLWALVTADIAPLKGRKSATPKPEMPKSQTPVKETQIRPTARVPVISNNTPKGRDLDRRTDQRLSRGQMDIEATLDLHGHGQGPAYESLCAFLQNAYARDMRCVLVITGKGKQGGGILRSRLPQWTDEPPLSAIVLKATQARQRDGGNGAFYVLLRRRR